MQKGRAATAAATAEAHGPATTADGTMVEVAANIGSLEDAMKAVAMGADGVGLLRTEFLFLGRDDMPGVDEQLEVYAAIGQALGERPLTIRTLDVGADKPLPYAAQRAEENPFLGLRGIRLGLAQRELLDVQLRAVARLARDRAVRVMFPMVATISELRAARAALDEAVGRTRPDGLEIGVMIEVPAAALMAEHLAANVDFFSIGTNDLSQYTMAAERGNAEVASLADPVHPAVLTLISHTAEVSLAHATWVGVCGELAGDARVAPLLLGLGVTELSMAPPSIPSVKQAVRSVRLAPARTLAQDALKCESAAEVRALLEQGVSR
jgi:phosphocarrier protein FPr